MYHMNVQYTLLRIEADHVYAMQVSRSSTHKEVKKLS